MEKLYGIPVSEGIAMGTAFIYSVELSDSPKTGLTPEKEKERYKNACGHFIRECRENAEKIRKNAGDSAAQILMSHASLASDPYSEKNAGALMDGGMSAEEAAGKVWGEWRDILLSSPDELTRGRGADADDILKGILSALSGKSGAVFPDGCVLVCREFTPSIAAVSGNVKAVVSEKGSVTSHGAILASGMGIPCVMGIDISGIADGDELICDGTAGEVTVKPDEKEKKNFEVLSREYQTVSEELRKYIGMSVKNRNGKVISVSCNAGSLSDVEQSIKCGGDGIGLFRTEFLFSEKEHAPDTEEQFSVYKTAAQMLCGRELIIRTLDAGGDKKIPYLDFPKEDNPFLGLRGIRYCLENTELFKTQLKAIIKASAFGNISIMLPMVTTEEEIIKTRELMKKCTEELEGDGYTVPPSIPVGIMTETPAAVFAAENFARYSDFFSVGTNDLTQYIMAADRGNGYVKDLYNTMEYPVRRAVEMTVRAAKAEGIPCHVCGEAAADEKFLDFLIELDIDSVSVSPKKVTAVKKRIIEG